MTLLLGALTKHCTIMVADGFSIRTHSDGRKSVEKQDLNKIFQINDSIALAHHGENVLNNIPVEQLIDDVSASFSSIRCPYQVGYQLFSELDPVLRQTKSHLKQFGSGFGLWITGFSDFPFLHELWWNSNCNFERKVFGPHRVIWGGDGKIIAKSMFDQRNISHSELADMTKPLAQKFVRELYEASVESQGGQPLLGGSYQELTIDAHGITRA